METVNESKKLVQVVLENDALEAFKRLKARMGFKNESEVLRRAIIFTEKKDK